MWGNTRTRLFLFLFSERPGSVKRFVFGRPLLAPSSPRADTHLLFFLLRQQRPTHPSAISSRLVISAWRRTARLWPDEDDAPFFMNRGSEMIFCSKPTPFLLPKRFESLDITVHAMQDFAFRTETAMSGSNHNFDPRLLRIANGAVARRRGVFDTIAE